MRNSRIIIFSTGVFSLVLAGIYSQINETREAPPQTAATISSGLQPQEINLPEQEQPRDTRHTTKPSLVPRDLDSPSISTPSSGDSTAETNKEQAAAGVEEALSAARQEMDPQQRIAALLFLGEHALQEHLNVLQQIQIQDPAPEVRRAAEDAIHVLMARFIDQPWPGASRIEEPFGYMRAANSTGEHQDALPRLHPEKGQ